MTIPSTSILIAAYNAAGTVARAVRSALAAFWEGTQSIALTSLPETSLPLYIYSCYIYILAIRRSPRGSVMVTGKAPRLPHV
jgi:hypothetical protein